MTSLRPPQVAQRLVDAYITGLRQRLPTLCIRRLDHLPGATDEQLLRLRQAYPGTPPELLYLLQRVNGTYWEAIRAPTHIPARAADGASPATATTTAATTSNSNSSSSGASPATGRQSAKEAAASFFRATLTGPDRKAVNQEKIAVPILGSALGSCPYFLKAVEDIVEPFQQPFPPKRKTAPCQPLTEDDTRRREEHVAAAEEGEGAASAMSAAAGQTSPAAADDAGGVGTMNGRLRPPAASTIEAIYRNHQIIRGPPPSDAGGHDGSAVLDSAAAADSGEGGEAPRKVVYVDPRIDTRATFGQWLAFADSMLPHHQPWQFGDEDENGDDNNSSHHSGARGEAEGERKDASPQQQQQQQQQRKASVSRLYIDFAPEPMSDGVQGQVIQYSRGEPESFTVIASNFGDYLKFVMAEEYEFTEELDDDDDGDGDGSSGSSGEHSNSAVDGHGGESDGRSGGSGTGDDCEGILSPSSGRPIETTTTPPH